MERGLTNGEMLIQSIQERNMEMVSKLIRLASMTCNACSKDKSQCPYCNHEFLRHWIVEEYKGK